METPTAQVSYLTSTLRSHGIDLRADVAPEFDVAFGGGDQPEIQAEIARIHTVNGLVFTGQIGKICRKPR